ncbi:MAG: Hsp33 family molecular chaperone HslO [Cellulosilyticaceae bacterium]
MKDYLIRGTDKAKNFRFFAVNTTEAVNEAVTAHKTSPVVSAALGRTMTGTIMLGAMLKNDRDRVAVSIKGNGPMKGVIAEADRHGNVKAYPFVPNVDLPNNAEGKLDVQAAIGMGDLTVVKDMGLKEPYVGQVPLLSGEIAEDFALYFAESEQINSVVALGVLVDCDYSVKKSGGFIIQVLPFTSDEAITELEERLKNFKSITQEMEKGKTIEDIIKQLLGEDVEIMETMGVKFKCDCSRERMERGLISIGTKELTAIAEDEQDDVELVCHFCNQKYDFHKEHIKELLKELNSNSL